MADLSPIPLLTCHDAAIVITVLCALCLLASELVAEVGVSSSNLCGPVAKVGPVLSAESPASQGTNITIAFLAGAAHLQSVVFRDGPLTSVRSGFPHNVSEKTCVKCLAEQPILSDCRLTDGPSYPARKLSVAVRSINTPLHTVATAFKVVKTGEIFEGEGDVVHVGETCSSFLLMVTGKLQNRVQLTYLEYTHTDDCDTLFKDAQEHQGEKDPRWHLTHNAVHTRNVHCSIAGLRTEELQLALLAFRTTQLENSVSRAAFDDSEKRYSRIVADDVYRAALAWRLADREERRQTYWEYSECGRYDAMYMLPLAACLLLLSGLLVLAYKEGAFQARRDLPYATDGLYDEIWKRGSAREVVHEMDAEKSSGLLSVLESQEIRLECDHARELMRVAVLRPSLSTRRNALPIRRGRWPRFRVFRAIRRRHVDGDLPS